jgi:hypothetical protein
VEQKKAESSDPNAIIRQQRIGGAASCTGRLDIAEAVLSATDFVLEQQLLLQTAENMALLSCQRAYAQVRTHTRTHTSLSLSLSISLSLSLSLSLSPIYFGIF